LLFAGASFRDGLRNALILAAPAVLLIATQLAFRLAYYGDWVPNTAHAKVAFSAPRAGQGWRYWWQGVWPLAALAIPALTQSIVGLLTPARRARTLLFVLPLLTWSAWVIAIGGDVFAGRRHLVIVVLLMAFLAVDFWRTWRDAVVAKARPRVAVAAIASLVLLGWMQWSQDPTYRLTGPQVDQAKKGESLGRMLGVAFAEQRPLVAMTAAGAIPYYSKLPSLDMLGLNDRYLAHHPPPDLGRGRVAHELGDGKYFLRRAPDLVVFCGRRGRPKACSRGGVEMQQHESFEDDYELVAFLGTEPVRVRGFVYVRRASPSIGVRVGADRSSVEIPGFLLTGGRSATALLNDENELVVSIAADKAASLEGVSLPAGVWHMETDANGPTERVILSSQNASQSGSQSALESRVELARASGHDTLVFALGEETRVDVSVSPIDGPVQVSGVRLTRVAASPAL
jgi:hypothetical protein